MRLLTRAQIKPQSNLTSPFPTSPLPSYQPFLKWYYLHREGLAPEPAMGPWSLALLHGEETQSRQEDGCHSSRFRVVTWQSRGLSTLTE